MVMKVMLISDSGTLVRTRTDEVSIIGRNTQGVRLIHLADNEHLVAIDKIPADLFKNSEVIESEELE